MPRTDARSRPPRRPPPRLAILIASVAVLGAGAVLARSLGGRPRADNLLLITLDTTRADALGCYGNEQARTPALDRLAREAFLFRHCSTCTPLTLPAHCTLLTGTYPFVHGVRRNGFEPLSPESTTLAEILQASGFGCEAVTGSVVLRSTFGLRQGFDRYSDVDPKGSANVAMAERRGDRVADEGIAALARLRGRRFFLWLHFYDPHYPYESERVADPLSPEAYADEVAFMDAQVGRVLEELRRLRLDNRTLVAVVGDHGEGLGEHGESEHGYFVYESTLRVPWLLRVPGTGRRAGPVEPLVRTIDLVPTVLDLLQLPPAAGAQGRSLRPLLSDRGAAARPGEETEPPAYGETHSAHEVFSLNILRSLTRAGWKYIHAAPPELYDLRQDPQERQNLAAREPERTARMRDELRALLAAAPPRPQPTDGPTAVPPDDAELFRSLGYVGGDPETGAAAPIAVELFEPQGDNPALHADAIERYARSHRLTAARAWAEAEPILQTVVRDLPDAPHPRNDLVLALRQLGREEEVLEILGAAVERQPRSASLRLFYAGRLLQVGRREEAIAQVAEAARQAPEDAAAQAEYGQVLLAGNRLDEARARFDRALRLDPRRAAAWRGLATVAARRDSLERAEECLRRALALEPRSAQLQRELEAIRARRSAPRP